MRLSRNAIGNLIARYSAILKKCAVINFMAAGLLLGGMHGVAGAHDYNAINSIEALEAFLAAPLVTSGTLSGNISGIKWGTGKEIATTKTLDLNGKTLSCADSGIGINANGYTLTVSGGTMSGFGTALKAMSTTATISNSTFTGSGTGIYAKNVDFHGTNTVNSIVSDGKITNDGTLKLTGSVDGVTGTYTQTDGLTDFSALETTLMNGIYNINGGAFLAENVTVGTNGALNVTGGTASIGGFAMNGGDFVVDPSDVKINAVSGDIDGNFIVGQGSRVLVGMEAAGAWDTSIALLGLNAPVTVGATGKIVVHNGFVAGTSSASDYADNVTFGTNSVLVVNGEAALNAEKGMINTAVAGATAKIADTSKLVITNSLASVGDTFNILSGFTIEATDAAWNGDQLVLDSAVVEAKFDKATGNVVVVAAPEPVVDDALKNLDGELKNLVVGMFDGYDATKPGAQFIERATNPRIAGNGNLANGVKAMESVSRIGALGAVPQMSIMASESLTDAIGNRMNIANGMNAIQEQKAATGLALWITPLWKNQTGWGLEACSFNNGFVGNIGGIALGADYAFSDFWKAGLAFNIGGGYATSNGDLQETDNNMNFWGLGVYGGYNDGTLSVMADVAYTGTYNKLEQSMVEGIYSKKANADVQASLWTVGIRGDYKFALEALDITPHVGLRFQSLSSQEYDIKAGGTVAKSDGISQTIWSVPVGVTFAKDFTTEKGWAVTPSVDFTVTPRFGDLKATESIKFTGVAGEADLRTQTRDYVTYKGTAGIGAKYNNIGLNLNYSYEGGSCTSSHGVNASFRWEF